MTTEKLFYKYQSLKAEKDDNGNDIIYTLENLANNQLYFSDPITFNDPFDSKLSVNHNGTREMSSSLFCVDILIKTNAVLN